MTYKEQLLDPRWQRRRLDILERDEFKCQLCYDPFTTLHIHHFYYRNIMAWEYQDHELITYCKHCHSIAEYYKKIDERILIAKVIKRPVSDGIENLFSFIIDRDSVKIDVFKYEAERVHFLVSMDGFTVYTLNNTLNFDIIKETENV